jgi:polysaccharide biosynthesis protein PelD
MMTAENIATGRVRPWLETLALSALGPGAGMLWNPSDPFWQQGPVPWLVLTPLLCGAQYGALHGIVSSALLSGMAYAHAQGSGQGPAALGSWSVACLIVGALAGQFRDVAEARRARVTHEARELSEQLQRAQRAGHLLKLSHARLEERMAAGRWSLAGALDAAVRRMQELSSRRDLGSVLLEVLGSQAMVQAATLYWTQASELLPSAIAQLGEQVSTDHEHPLVQRAWNTRRLAAIVDAAVLAQQDDPGVLVAVPLLTSSGRCIGVVAVHQMPFMAFQTDQLRNLFVISGQLADLMQDRLTELAQPHGALAKPLGWLPPLPPPPLGADRGLAVDRAPVASALFERPDALGNSAMHWETLSETSLETPS